MTEKTKDVGGRPALSWSQRPATGRSFLMMMILAVLASGVAVFLAIHSPSEQQTRRAAEALRRRNDGP
jgi:type II secretory pathway component PulM